MRRLVAVALALALATGPGPSAVAEISDPPELTATGAVLWDPQDDLVLYGRAERVARPMASTTKLMTVLLAAESGTVDDEVTVSQQAATLGGATLHLQAGQRVPMESLVAGLLLESGNDAAVAVAEHVAGSESAFVEAMNHRAATLGLEETTFVDPHGLNADPTHRASPLDLVRLAHVALEHEVIADFARMPTATVPGLDPLVNRNELLDAYPFATGVKTGFTSLAGFCLVASAERDGRTLYAAVLDSEARFAEAQALLEYGFEAFRRVEPLAGGEVVTRYRWADGDVAVVADEGLAATVRADADVLWRMRLRPAVTRPLAAGRTLGVASLHADGVVVREVPLVAGHDSAVGAPGPPAARAGGAVQEALRAFGRLVEVDRRA